jgi:soluble lytic murein transglycosylase
MRGPPLRRALFVVLPLILVAGACLMWLLRDSIRSPEVLYAEAQAARPPRAGKLYETLAERLPGIADYALLWQAETAMPDPEAFRTLQLLTEYRPTSPEAYLAQIAIARHYAATDAPPADAAYLAALTLHETPSLRLELARFYEERGNSGAAYDQYRRLLPVKQDAFVGMRRNATDPPQLAEDLIHATYFSDALEVLRNVNETDASRLRGLAYLGLGQFPSAATEVDAWLRGEPDDNEDRQALAQALAQFGHIDKAIEVFGSIDSPESQLVRAQLLEAESPDEAIALYEASPYPVAWWNATWLLEADGRIEDAMALYSRIAASEAYFNDDAAYRLLILGTRTGRASAVAQAKGFLKGFGPNWLAQRAGVASSELSTGPSVEPLNPDILPTVESLERLGRADLAALELLFCARYQSRLPARLACLDGLAARGRLLEAEPIVADMLDGLPKPPPEILRLAFPRPYTDAVITSANEFGLDPLLIWSVMRVESRYNPNAGSPVGARGLMQIIPATQAWLEEQLGLELAPGEIFVPEVNIRLGAWYLAYLRDEFDGDMELAIPAYNAGPDNVRAWLRDPMVKDRDDFIRWIGFGETREYLEKVSIAYWQYRQIYMP